MEFNGLWEARPSINDGLLGSQHESVDHTCVAPPLSRWCSKKEFHFTLVFCETNLDTNRLLKFALSWIWHNINVLCWHIVMYPWNSSVKVEGAGFIKWFDKSKWHVPFTKDYFHDVLRLLGTKINFWNNKYDNKKKFATTDWCSVQCKQGQKTLQIFVRFLRWQHAFSTCNP